MSPRGTITYSGVLALAPLLLAHCLAMPHHEPGHDHDILPNEMVNGTEMGGPAEPPIFTGDESTLKLENEIPQNISTSLNITSVTTDNENGTTTESSGLQEETVTTTAAASSTSTSFLSSNDPTVQLLPPPFAPSSANSQHILGIPISVLSIAGNDGGTTRSNVDGETETTTNVDFTQFRYHMETGQLHSIGSTGPQVCPPNMRFFAIPGNAKSGDCDCDYYQCSRPLIYSPEKNQCYWAWSQGPCDKGEWYVFEKDLKKRGKCVKNPCPQSPIASNGTLEYIFQNPEDETCYEAGTQGYCKDADERLIIYPGEPIPICRKFTLCYPLSIPQEMQCIFGNKLYFQGNC